MWLFIALGVFVLISGCVSTPTEETTTSLKKTTITTIKAPTSTTTITSTTLTRPLIECDEIVDIRKRDDCFFNVATSQNNWSLCDEIARTWRINWGIPTNTRGNCLAKIADSLGDYTICEKINRMEYKEECYSNLAVKLNDSSICDIAPDVIFMDRRHRYVSDHKNKSLRKSCYNAVANINKNVCEKYGGVWKSTWDNSPYPKPTCNLPTSDAGKECTDSSQCETYCQAKEGAKSGTKDTGKCYGWYKFICIQTVTNGVVNTEVCK